ncbi:MAG: sigma-70 family RNA polymerase sigma factor [Planctomycetes bacterium]|nr:sigma-70 family RNA polymerase sigma factor [Planctomycetota bacterium]
MEPSLDVAALVEAHHAGVWRYLRYLGCDRALADDLTQETFLAVMQKPFEYRGSREAAGYLRLAARNLFLVHVRRSKLIKTVEDLEQADAAWERAHADDSDARQRALNECLQTVQGKARQVLDLQYRDKRSGEEIAALLKITAQNVRTIVHRAKAALKDCIDKKLGGEA